MPDNLAPDQVRMLKIVDEVEDYAIVLLDKYGTVESWNAGAKRILGYDSFDIIGKHFTVFYSPQDKADHLHEQSINQAMESGKNRREGWRVRKDGSRFWGSIVLTAIHNDDGAVIGFTKVIQDLTVLRQSTQMLRQAEERYNKMVKEIADYAIILLDVEGNIVTWNDGAEKIKGYNADEAIGKNFQVFYLLEDQQKNIPLDLLERARAEGRVQHTGWRLRKDGTAFWAAVSITALHGDLNQVIGFSKITHDLTDKMVSEKALERHVVELKAKNKELEQFSYITSHDLQEPLRTITNFSDLLQTEHSSELSEQAAMYVGFIMSAASRMSQLIKCLLDYSRIGANKVIGEVDCKHILKNIEHDLHFLISETNALLKYDDMPVISGYATEVYQVFQNLITNAIKYRKLEISPEILITSEEQEDKWLFMIKDNGIGMNPKFSNKIFLIFQRLHGRDQYPGDGIGLATCKKIVEMHSGEIWAESEPGKGSTFYFTIARDLDFSIQNPKNTP